MVLRLEHVSYTYSADTPWAVTAINDVSFAVEQGEVVGIVGHTGSGKSSLAQLICGLIPADSGQIWLNDLQIVGVKKLKAVELVKRVGMVFQYPECGPARFYCYFVGLAKGTSGNHSLYQS